MSIECPFAFQLDAAEPAATGKFDLADETLGEMVETIFHLDTEDAILDWAGNRFGLSYKYDISMMVDDILELLGELTSTPSGKKVIDWASSNFPYRWEVTWAQPNIEICAMSHERSNMEQQKLELICDTVSHFVAEWIPILDTVRSAAAHAGYDVSKLRNGESLLSFLEN